MSSSPLPPVNPVDENENETAKPQRLPKSVKKRLRFERRRQKRKETAKKIKRRKWPNLSSSAILPSDTNESLIEPRATVTGKVFRQTANARLEEIYRESIAPVICIDCAYNQAMSAKELASLARQIGRCYSSNRRAIKPVQLVLTNWSSESLLAQECRRVNSGFDNFKIVLNAKPICEAYPTEHLVYLSPNAENQLTEINEQNIYVIGGLVDESVRKNMTLERCLDKQISCYKLPIETYMEHSVNGGTFNKILSINQVFDILITYIMTHSWEEALKNNIPERKGWVVKKKADTDDNKSNAV